MPTIALARPQNCLLARLPAVEHHRLYARLRLVPLKLRQVLYQAQAPITHAYFPIRGVVSAVIVMGNGNAIEVGTVGREGVIGLPCFLRPENSTTRVVVLVAGEA